MEGKLNGLDLFSGIGGNTLGLRDYIKTVAYCEQDRHAQSVLLSRMADGSIEPAPIWDDITTLTGSHFDTPIDIIVGGFPCQDISVAGKGAGLEGERSGLFFEIVRLAKEIKPTFIFLENVPAIRTRGLDTVIQELTEAGYDCRWAMLSAYDVGAPHKRERWWLLAHSNSNRQQGESQRNRQESQGGGALGRDPNRFCDSVAQALFKGLEGQRQEPGRVSTELSNLSDNSWWAAEPNVGRVVNGVSLRMDRLKRLGNAVVPLQAKEAFCRLMGIYI